MVGVLVMALRLFAWLWCCLVAIAQRRRRTSLAIALVGVAVASGLAHAACDVVSLYEAEGAYEEAVALERSGSVVAALAAYARASAPSPSSEEEGRDEGACPVSPLEIEAAWRAAALAGPLGRAAEQAARLEQAFGFYEAGGHFAAADRVLVALVRSRSEDFAFYDAAVRHFSRRALPAFAHNMRARLEVTGRYAPDPALLARLSDLPAKRALAALAAESKSFDEDYLRAVVRLEGTRAAASVDVSAMQAAAVARHEFAARWPSDPLAESRRLLRSAREWASRDQNTARGRGFATRVALRYADRAHLLVQAYSAAPALLVAAMDYHRESRSDVAAVAAELARVRTVARQLARQSADAGHYRAAAEYYDAAGDHALAAAARETQYATTFSLSPVVVNARSQAMGTVSPFGTREQAEALERQFADAVDQLLQAAATREVTEM